MQIFSTQGMARGLWGCRDIHLILTCAMHRCAWLSVLLTASQRTLEWFVTRGWQREGCCAAGLEDVKPGAAVDLPIWLLMELAKRDMIAIKWVPLHSPCYPVTAACRVPDSRSTSFMKCHF